MTPGSMIAADLKRLGWTQRKLATALEVDYAVINRLVNDRGRITLLRALQLEAVTGRDAEEYLRAQLRRDLEAARNRFKAGLSVRKTTVTLEDIPTVKKHRKREIRKSDK